MDFLFYFFRGLCILDHQLPKNREVVWSDLLEARRISHSKELKMESIEHSELVKWLNTALQEIEILARSKTELQRALKD